MPAAGGAPGKNMCHLKVRDRTLTYEHNLSKIMPMSNVHQKVKHLPGH